MIYKKLGQTDLEVSGIGFGAWGIGGAPFWNSEGDKKSERAILRAVDEGINFFDTAPVYGFGHSEELLGKTLEPVRDDVIIASKFGLIWKKEKVSSISRDCSRSSILKEIDLSLKRLRTDRIDLYQVHWPDSAVTQEETIETLLELQDKGKIRYFGVSNYSIEELNACMNVAQISSLQTQYSLLERSNDNEIIPFCREHHIGILAYSPLASGVLTGKYDKKTQFTDWRSRGILGQFSGAEYERNIDKVDRLKKVARKTNGTCARLAIKWLISQPVTASALVGVKNEKQVTENCKGIDCPLEEKYLSIINEIF